MATRTKSAATDLYEEDFYDWSERQTRLLRARRFDELDLGNLIEEVEDLGGALRRSVLNNVRVILEHLLKLEHSPAGEPRGGWEATVLEHCSRLDADLTARLRHILAAELPRMYGLARRNAAAALYRHGEHAAANVLPETCPYTPDQIIGDWWP